MSETQQRLAKRILPGDVLIHYIDAVRAWVGYSTVNGPMEDNKRDADGDWVDALPSVIPIRSEVWLTMYESESSTEIAGLKHSNYYRQNAFTPLAESDAMLVINAIRISSGTGLVATAEFQKRWHTDAESYYWTIARRKSKGKCWLCGETAAAWIDKQDGLKWLPQSVKEVIGERFVDMAHITARKKKGKVAPDNIRGLCPNCHRIVDRIPEEICLEVFKRKSHTN